MFCKLIPPIAIDFRGLLRTLWYVESFTRLRRRRRRPSSSRVVRGRECVRPPESTDRPPCPPCPTDPWSTVDFNARDASHVGLGRARDGRRQSLRRGRRRVGFHRRCVLHRLRSESTSKSEGDARRFGGMMMTMTTMSMMSLVRARDRGSRTNAFEVTRRRRRRVRRERRRGMGVMTKETEAR